MNESVAKILCILIKANIFACWVAAFIVAIHFAVTGKIYHEGMPKTTCFEIIITCLINATVILPRFLKVVANER